jgi:biofilm PGA synthesis N-glycosyltransferase PgaC
MSKHTPSELHDPEGRKYVLMTAAHNEEKFIERTITSVLAQNVRPQRWVIVSDNSTDRTDEIVENYSRQYDFVRFVRVARPPARRFEAKGIALQRGSKLLGDVAFDFIGNIDADISVPPSYFEELIRHFERDPELGLAAGFIHEEMKGEFRSRRSNRVYSVPHAAQLVRRECYEAIGGYAVLRYGGEDWYSQTHARMSGWRVQAIPTLSIFHHRHTGTGTNLLQDRFRSGRMDYSFGSDPVFEIFKCLERLPERPLFIGGITRLAGFSWSYVCRDKRPVSDEFVAFLRSEQRLKVLSLLRNLVRLKAHPWKDLLGGRST